MCKFTHAHIVIPFLLVKEYGRKGAFNEMSKTFLTGTICGNTQSIRKTGISKP